MGYDEHGVLLPGFDCRGCLSVPRARSLPPDTTLSDDLTLITDEALADTSAARRAHRQPWLEGMAVYVT